MMKNVNRGLLVIAAFLLVATIGLSSYAIYKSQATGEATASVANWAVSINSTDAVTESEFSFNGNQIEWTANANIAEGKIAPGRTGYIPVTIDASGSEVSVEYAATINSVTVDGSAVSNDAITVSLVDSNNATLQDNKGVIALADVATPQTIKLKIVWAGNDETDQNNADLALEGKDIKINVTIVAKQYLGD